MAKQKNLFSMAGVSVPTNRQRRSKREAEQPADFCQCVADWFGIECVTEYRFHPPRRWRFDYALPSVKVAVEVEGAVWAGGRHVRPSGFIKDMEKYNTAAVTGWTLTRTTPQELVSDTTRQLIATAINHRHIAG